MSRKLPDRPGYSIAHCEQILIADPLGCAKLLGAIFRERESWEEEPNMKGLVNQREPGRPRRMRNNEL